MFSLLSVFTTGFPLRKAREDLKWNYSPHTAKHDQHHFGIQGNAPPMGLTSLIKTSLLGSTKDHLELVWISFEYNQRSEPFCPHCHPRSNVEDTKMHDQMHSRLIQFIIRFRIIDECCSLTTQLALVLHFETMAISLLICRNDAAFGSRGINRGATELHMGVVFLYHPNDPMIDDTIKLFTKGSLRDKCHHPRRIVFLTGEATARVTFTQKQVGRFCGTSPKAIWTTFTKTGRFPCRGCVSVRARESLSQWILCRTFLSTHSSQLFPSQPQRPQRKSNDKGSCNRWEEVTGPPLNSTALTLSGDDWLPRYCCCIVIYLHVSSHTYYIWLWMHM